MTSVIVSHDVDHLFATDHWFRDWIYPKMWVRTSLELIQNKITGQEWWLRNSSCFRKNRHNLDSLMDFDSEHGVPSTFFFGMRHGLGMSYNRKEAKPLIEHLHKSGFATGVHGINFSDQIQINAEHEDFRQLVGFEPCGIRMHYVRFNESTFQKLSQSGYHFDSTEFDKHNGYLLKNPYKVGDLWEFPLTVMDGYLPQKFELAKDRTLWILQQCMEQGINYVSILFHDFQFCDDYKDMHDWYVWLIRYLSNSKDYEFSSYEKAMVELEALLNVEGK